VKTPEFVADASALAAIAFGEPGADNARTYLKRHGCVMHEVNVSELCFTLPRKRPDDFFDPEMVRFWLRRMDINMVDGFSADLGRVVASIRLRNQALNLGDGVAVAMAIQMDIPLLTADKAFAKSSPLIKVELIR